MVVSTDVAYRKESLYTYQDLLWHFEPIIVWRIQGKWTVSLDPIRRRRREDIVSGFYPRDRRRVSKRIPVSGSFDVRCIHRIGREGSESFKLIMLQLELICWLERHLGRDGRRGMKPPIVESGVISGIRRRDDPIRCGRARCGGWSDLRRTMMRSRMKDVASRLTWSELVVSLDAGVA